MYFLKIFLLNLSIFSFFFLVCSFSSFKILYLLYKCFFFKFQMFFFFTLNYVHHFSTYLPPFFFTILISACFSFFYFPLFPSCLLRDKQFVRKDILRCNCYHLLHQLWNNWPSISSDRDHGIITLCWI